MATRPVPKHIETLWENLGEVSRLYQIHTQISGHGPGYKHDVQVLNKSAVVLIVACWEAFIEDLALSAFDEMLDKAVKPDIFPAKVLTLASKDLKNSENEMRVWDLAGENWKKVLTQHRGKIKKKHIDSLNTPRAEQIDTLFESMIGLKRISSVWYWPGMSNVKAKKRLSDLITLRGSIAHRVATSKTVNKKYATDQSLFIQRLAAQAHNKTLSFIEDRTGKAPWSYYSFGKVY